MILSSTVALPANCLRLLLNKHMVRMIMELIRNQTFTLLLVTARKAGLPSEKQHSSGIGLGSPPFQFLCLHLHLPTTISKKFNYADDLALLRSCRNWKVFEETLNQNMTKLLASDLEAEAQ